MIDRYLEFITDQKNISLGLDSWSHLLKFLPKKSSPLVITVAGTNGKGSLVAVVAAALQAAGISYAAYTSPHLHDFKERLTINSKLLTDKEWLQAFMWLEQISDGTKLSPFEFYTLSALYLAYSRDIQVLLLEVGLGGRLDAVNAIEPDIAVITEIDFDHTDRLGSSLSEIAYAKSGIMRAGKPVIYAGANAKADIIDCAQAIGAKLYFTDICTTKLPIALPKASAMAALKLAELLPFNLQMAAAIENFNLPGRFEICKFAGKTIIFDVAHNPAAMANLASNLRAINAGKVGLWLSLAKTKDIAGCALALRDHVARVCLSNHSIDLAYDCNELSFILQELAYDVVGINQSYTEADQVLEKLSTANNDVVLITGSFQHVAMVQQNIIRS